MEDVLKRIEFAFFYFLNYYVSINKPSKEGRKNMQTNLRKKQTMHIFANDLLKPLTSVSEIGDPDNFVVSYTHLHRMLQENQPSIHNMRKKDKYKYPIIKEQFKSCEIRIKSEEELIEMDDNEIIGKLLNYTGLLNLWSSLHLQDR